MATITPTVLSYGGLDATGTNWTDVAVGGAINMSRPPASLAESWVQFDFTPWAAHHLNSGTLSFTIGQTGFNYKFDLLVAIYPLTQVYSDSYLPNRLPRLTYVDAFGTLNYSVASPQTLTIPLHTSAGAATTLLSALRRSRTADSGGVVRLGLGVRLSESSPSTPVTINWNDITFDGQPQFTGLSGPYRAHGRADECPVCGGKSTRDTWVRSGYLQMMVCPHCYDEEDLVGRHLKLGTEKPPVGEG